MRVHHTLFRSSSMLYRLLGICLSFWLVRLRLGLGFAYIWSTKSVEYSVTL